MRILTRALHWRHKHKTPFARRETRAHLNKATLEQPPARADLPREWRSSAAGCSRWHVRVCASTDSPRRTTRPCPFWHLPPSIDAKRFTCPHCGAIADQIWFDVYASRTGNQEGTPPTLPTDDDLAKARAAKPKREAEVEAAQKRLVTFLEKAASGALAFWGERILRPVFSIANLFASYCVSCDDIAIWKRGTMLYPRARYEVEPADDLPEEITHDFNEAREILDLSPRGAAALLRLCIQKLCIHLGLPGKSIDADIATLVQRGLDPRVQKAFDIVRIVQQSRGQAQA
jgi:Domain of unknown function (DUF4145)